MAAMNTYFTKLTTNVKSPQTREIPLGPKTVITGPNRSGKTSVLSAIRLALTGRHPGVNAKQPATFGALTAGTRGDLHAVLDGVHGARAAFAVRRVAGKLTIEGPDVEGIPDIEGALPIFAMGNLLALGSDKMRELLFRRFAQVRGKPRPMYLDQVMERLWDEASASVDTEDSIEFLTGVKKRLDAMKRERNASVRYLDDKIKQTRGWLASAAAGAETIEELEVALSQAQAAESAHQVTSKLALRRGSLEQAQGALTLAQARVAETEAAQAQVVSDNAVRFEQIAALEAQAQQVAQSASGHMAAHQRGQTILEVLKLCESSGAPSCPVCTSQVASWPQIVQQLEAKLEARAQQAQQVSEQTSKIRGQIQTLLAAANRETARVNQEVSQARTGLLSHKSRLAVLQAEIEGLVQGLGSAAEYTGPSVATLQERLNLAREAQHRSRQLEEYSSEMLIRQRESDICKALEKEAASLQTNLIATCKETAEQSVNAYMPDGFRAVLDLDAHEWKCIGADGEPHSKATLSGSEICSLVIALALAFSEGAPVRVVTLDADADLSGFSKDSFKHLCDRLALLVDEGVLDQVIMTWLRPDEVPAGWDVVRLPAASSTSEAEAA